MSESTLPVSQLIKALTGWLQGLLGLGMSNVNTYNYSAERPPGTFMDISAIPGKLKGNETYHVLAKG